MKLLKKQTKAIDLLEDKITTEVNYGGAAGGGKSDLGAIWLIQNCIKYPGSRWLMGRSKLKTLKSTTLLTFFERAKIEGLQAKKHFIYNEIKSTIYFPSTESTIFLKDLFSYPSDPEFDDLGSLEITGAFIDECVQISEKAWEIVKSRIRYKLDEFGVIPKILGTCNPSKNWVYKRFYKPWKEGNLPDYMQFIPALPTDNPHLSHHYIESLEKLKDKATKERLLYGNWEYDDDPAKLMDFDSILDLFENNWVEPGKYYLTIDAARYGSDTTKLIAWCGFQAVERTSMDQSSIPEIYNEAERIRKKYRIGIKDVICDDDGVGGGVVDLGKYTGFINNSTAIKVQGNNENYKNLADQCSFMFAEKVMKKEVWFNAETTDTERNEIIEEMECIKRDKIDDDGKLCIIPKKIIKTLIGRSPDWWDCFKMRMLPVLKSPTIRKSANTRKTRQHYKR